MRIFVALDISETIRECISRFLDGVCGFVPDARWAQPESLHVTLKFIGEKSIDVVEKIEHALSKVDASALKLSFRGYGFFPTPKAARVFWIGIENGPQLAELVKNIDERLATLDIPLEQHAYTPHLTLARGGRGSGSPRRQKEDRSTRSFQRLQEKLAVLPPPEFGNMTACEFFLYESRVSHQGSRYVKLKSFALR